MKTRIGLIAAMCLTPVVATAGQPFEESLVECAVLIDLLTGEQTPMPGDSAEMDFFVGTAKNMRAEALRRTNAAYVEKTDAEKRQLWHERWDAGQWDIPSNRQELSEWWTYCFKFADHLGVDGPTPFDK
ncbi:MAG: hypothetical protein VX974_03225 [Pseudomonadota bacterium]|nr:hypothetical protein [Pseudomonadota bacterium]